MLIKTQLYVVLASVACEALERFKTRHRRHRRQITMQMILLLLLLLFF